MTDDLTTIIRLAQQECEGVTWYRGGLQLAYARTIDYLVRNWAPKPKTIIHSPADAEVRIRED